MVQVKKRDTSVQHVRIESDRAGQRLDNFLISVLKGVPKTHIYRILRKGEVRINKGRARPDYRLEEGDDVRIPPVRTAAAGPAPDNQGDGRWGWLEERVLYEDEALLAIDKPAGLAVHGGSGISLGLIEALRRLRPHSRFLELVHRLDRETSGCLLVAKKRAALVGLHALLREDGLDKRYLALVKGAWRARERVTAPLEKNQLRSGERMVSVSAAGKESETVFIPTKRYRDATLVEIELLTGRTHQARVHAAHSGHPIAGDDKYGDRTFNQAMRAQGLARLFLHAAELRFNHPVNGSKMRIAAPLPPELGAFLKRLEREPEEV
jgi:23S rRNA pseudouridine955/2504/2580 synthase